MDGMNELDLAIRQAVRQMISESADAEVEAATERFRGNMMATKNEMIGKIVNAIEIRCKHEFPGEYVIQVFVRGIGNG